MKLIPKILILLILSVSFLSSKGAEKYFTLTFQDGTVISVKTSLIKECNYISIQQVNKIVFPQSQYIKKKLELKIDNYRLKFTKNSFFMVYDLNEDIRILQFHNPVLMKKRKLMIPLHDFVNALKKLELYDLTISNWEPDDKQKKGNPTLKKEVEITHKSKKSISPPSINTKDINTKNINTKDKNTDEIRIKEDLHLSKPVKVEDIEHKVDADIKQVDFDSNPQNEPATQESLFKSSFKINSGEFLKGINTIYSIKQSGSRKKESSSVIEEFKPQKSKNPSRLVEKEYPPDRYVLPSKLKRAEIENQLK